MQSVRRRGTSSLVGARVGCAVALGLLIAGSALAQTPPTSPTHSWTAIVYPDVSSTSVPEPPSGGLAMVGAALAVVYWWRRDSRD